EQFRERECPPSSRPGGISLLLWCNKLSGLVHGIACPRPAARSVLTSGPRPWQQSASLPLITTAGTDRMPRLLARLATFGSFMSSTVTSHDGHAVLLTRAIVSSQVAQPALKISTLRLVAIVILLFDASNLVQRPRGSVRDVDVRFRPRVPERRRDQAGDADVNTHVRVEHKLADD